MREEAGVDLLRDEAGQGRASPAPQDVVRLTVDVRPGERLVLEYAPPASPALGRGALGPPPQTARQFDGRRVVTGVAWAVAVVVLIAVVGALAAVPGLA